MSNFERNLRDALRRREPPSGFAGKVLARAGEIDERREARSVWKWSWRWVSVAALTVMFVGGVSLYQEHQRQIQAEKSKEELMFALRLTSSRLQLVQEKLSAIERKRIEVPMQQ
jgi:multidrug efflux pump subunit AcrB